MKIVVLDGYTENPGDLSWDELAKLGDLTVYDRTPVNDEAEIRMGRISEKAPQILSFPEGGIRQRPPGRRRPFAGHYPAGRPAALF